MIRVIGIGPSDYSLVSQRARDKINKADILIGGKRNIDMVLGQIGTEVQEIYYMSSDLDKMKSYINDNIDKDICLIASGDPLIYGIGSYILRNFKRDIVDTEPGISSIQYAFSSFGLDMNEVYITSAHGRDIDMDFLLAHDKVAMVTDKVRGPKYIASKLAELGADYTMYVANRLGYDDEMLIESSPSEVKDIDVEFDLSVIILIRNK